MEDLIESLANGNVTGVKVVPGNGGGGGDESGLLRHRLSDGFRLALG
jgi:hypothetical protein